jgi:ketosteroid isomerase-like protein
MKILTQAVRAGAFYFSLAAISNAQEVTMMDAKTFQSLEAASKQYDEAFNKNDAHAIAGLFTPDAVEVGPEGLAYGELAIERRYADGFAKWHQNDRQNTIDRAYMLGDAAVVVSRFNVGSAKGYAVSLNKLDGDQWKIYLSVYNVTPSASPALTPTPTPSSPGLLAAPTPTPSLSPTPVATPGTSKSQE